MARIYYREEKLSGQAFENSIINLQLFDFIFSNTNTNKFEIEPISSNSFFGLKKSKKNTYKTVKISRDGRNYNSAEGSFFLPQAIIFYDNDDYSFPSKFYFIAKLVDKIEIRKCNGGKNVKWFQIPDLHQEVTDPKIISKIENTILEVKKLVETTHNKQIGIDKEKKEQEELRKIEKICPDLNEAQKNGYKVLTEICINLNSKKKDVFGFIENLKNYDKDSEYFSTLNYVMDFLDDNRIPFILRLDWKAGIEDLEWLLKSSLKDNFNLTIELPNKSDYKENASIANDNVFEDFDKPLREQGLQMGFIDTQSDEYIIVLHKISEKEKVKKATNEIGYNYYEK
ncbi:hypothetical protein B4Q04_07510 [Zobellia sp. OII3]|uniref:DUF6630 family protein n=1 Tax=Zobellia sp. OII3 TaxID=2034520 RepID=UPI000B52E929|nr:hypothetical protein [Zobellia sp. OII3]OWW25457.1 hypothetical protein B4Q04_07510 [Zobellia sp. OII3]